MMDTNVPTNNGWEIDAFCERTRHWHGFRAGARKYIKNGYRRRCRRHARHEIDEAPEQYTRDQVT